MTRRFCHHALALALPLALTGQAVWSDTRVANGGNAYTIVLQNMRMRLAFTLEQLPQDAQARRQRFATLCGAATNDPERIAGCAAFLLATVDELRTRVEKEDGDDAVGFDLAYVPMTAPDGVRADAATGEGPTGPITFAYARAGAFSQRELFQLMVHEFAHKVAYKDQYAPDTELSGALRADTGFATGRALLDAVAIALGEEAERIGKLGGAVRIQDVFTCVVKAGSDPELKVERRSARVFRGPDDARYSRYDSGIAINGDADPPPSMSMGNNRMRIRMFIEENANCDLTVTGPSARKTWFDGWIEDRVTGAQVEKLHGEVQDGFNPLCEPGKPAVQQFGDINWECSFSWNAFP